MFTNTTRVLDGGQIKQKSLRIAYQILEDSFEDNSIVLAGLDGQGYIFANRLFMILQEIAPHKSFLLLKVFCHNGLYSVDFQVDQSMELVRDKVVVLVDDVLNSGKTLMHSLGVFLNSPVKKIRVAVLVDRSHHAFPVSSDYYGIKLSTVLKEHVKVELGEENGKDDAAYLY